MKKLSVKFKILCYVASNLGSTLLAAIEFLQGASFGKTLIILVGSMVCMNLIFWYLFRVRDDAISRNKSPNK